MIYYNKIDVSEGTAINKLNESKECMILSLLVFFRFKLYI